MTEKADIGLIGLAVMGQNLVMNMADHGFTVAVGHAAVVEDLQQHIEYLRVGFFDFVKQEHGIGFPSNGLGEIAAFVVTNIARRGTDEAGHRMFFHEFRHVDAHHGPFRIEDEFGQGFGQLGFAHAGGAHENKRTDGPVGVLQA